MELSLADARHLALAAQGFGRRPAKPTVADVRKKATNLLAIHIDSINVVVRSQYLIPYSRLGPHPIDALDRLTYTRRQLFEGLGHSNALMPLHLYPLLRYRMAARERIGAHAPNGARPDPRYVEDVYDEVAARGPLTANELSRGGTKRGPWWGWSMGKVALEHLWACGRVAIAAREDFTRVYDIAERVIPGTVLDAAPPDAEESQKQLICLYAGVVGVGTARQLIDGFGLRHPLSPRGPDGRLPRPTWRRFVPELVEAGRLQAVDVETWPEKGYTLPGARVPRAMDVRALLSPFDELVRSCGLLTFGFTQHLGQQLYVPAERRVYGYYVLPFLLGDELVARCDLKADRHARTLRVVAAYTEPGHDARRVAPELAEELRQLANWLELDEIAVADKGDLAPMLLRSRTSVGARD